MPSAPAGHHGAMKGHQNAKGKLQKQHIDHMARQHQMDMGNVHWMTYGGAQGFGGQSMEARTVFAPGKRRRINIIGICTSIFVPFMMFAVLYCAMSFKVHYKRPTFTWGLAFFFLFVATLTAVYARRSYVRDREPRWLTFVAGSMFFAIIAAVIFGNLNYWTNLLPYYEIDSLNTYPAVNPKNDYGQMLMDAGRVYFTEGVGVDYKKSSSFQNQDLYCVAPIVLGEEKLSHYDFWAIGKNCCSDVSPDFRCGEFNNPKARSGLRLVEDADRQFYRMAVNVASAQFGLQSPHPLFFTWIQDPSDVLEAYLRAGWRFYLLGISCHFSLNLFAAVSATVLFSKIGHMSNVL